MACTYEIAFQIEPIDEYRELELVEHDLMFSSGGRIHRVLCSEVAQDGVAAAKAAQAKLERLGVAVRRAMLDLVNKADIADRAEVSKPTVADWTKQYNGAGGFPEEFDTIAGHPVWAWADVNEWLRRMRKPVFDGFTSLNRREVEAFNHWLDSRRHAPAGAEAQIERAAVAAEILSAEADPMQSAPDWPDSDIIIVLSGLGVAGSAERRSSGSIRGWAPSHA